MIFERLARIYAEPDFAFHEIKSEAGVKLYKRETIKKRQQEREVRKTA